MTSVSEIELTGPQQEVLDHLKEEPAEWKSVGGDGYRANLLLLVAIGAAQVKWDEQKGMVARVLLDHEMDDEARRRMVLLKILKDAEGSWQPIPDRMLAAARRLAEDDLVEVRHDPSVGYEARLAP